MFRGSRHESTPISHFCPRVKSLCSVCCSGAGWLPALLHIERTIHMSPFCEVRAFSSFSESRMLSHGGTSRTERRRWFYFDDEEFSSCVKFLTPFDTSLDLGPARYRQTFCNERNSDYKQMLSTAHSSNATKISRLWARDIIEQKTILSHNVT